jgi:uncharacterized protein
MEAYMKRLIDKHLKQWAESPHRKSLLLRGARQVGKTHAVRTLGEKFSNYVEINFELTPEAIALFDKDLNAERLIRDLSVFTGKQIEPGKTLLFLDEIQAAPKAVTSLRYFYENAPLLHVVAAGSHLGFAFDEVGVPVGRVSILQMRPLSFLEFLCASGSTLLAGEIVRHDPTKPLNSTIHNKAIDLLGEYHAVGGMPESAAAWIEHHDLDICRGINLDIVKSNRQDLDKYGAKFRQKFMGIVFEALPRQMGTKFRYHAIHGEYRKSQLAPALDLLEKIGVATKVFHTSAQGVPLGGSINPDHFKVILEDIALSQAMLGLPAGEWILHAPECLENRGEMIEAFAGQELLAYQDPSLDTPLYYWHRESRSSNAEVDYVIQQENAIIPVEVKSGTSGWLRSMHKFLEEHPASPYGLRFCSGDYHVDGKIKSYPLYAIAGAVGVAKESLEYIIGA